MPDLVEMTVTTIFFINKIIDLNIYIKRKPDQLMLQRQGLFWIFGRQLTNNLC
jgi:hypothetical protein